MKHGRRSDLALPRVYGVFHTLSGKVDGRSPAARRHKYLVGAFLALMGPEPPTEPQIALVHRAADLDMQCEAVQAAMCRGEEIDTREYCRLANAQRRLFVILDLLPLPGAESVPRSLRQEMGV